MTRYAASAVQTSSWGDLATTSFYGGAGGDGRLNGGKGEDVVYGGGGGDFISGRGDRQPDKLYCGKGKDEYLAEKIDHVDSSCELNLTGGVVV